MIILNGIKSINSKVSLLKFTNEKNENVDIPVSKDVAETISLHLRRLSNDPDIVVEVGNEETEE